MTQSEILEIAELTAELLYKKLFGEKKEEKPKKVNKYSNYQLKRKIKKGLC